MLPQPRLSLHQLRKGQTLSENLVLEHVRALQDDNRGENIVRLKVKTRNALEHIVPFIERCQKENLILTVSCPISTKKGRQQVRGFLAYLETRTAEDADRLEDLVREYNTEHKSVFNTWHRNPVSTWKTPEQ